MNGGMEMKIFEELQRVGAARLTWLALGALALGVTACGPGTAHQGHMNNEAEEAEPEIDLEAAQQAMFTDEPGMHLVPGTEFMPMMGELARDTTVDFQMGKVFLTGQAASVVRDQKIGPGDVVFGYTKDTDQDYALYVESVLFQSNDDVTLDVHPLYLTDIVYGDWDYAVPMDNEQMTINGQPLRQYLESEEDLSSIGENLDLGGSLNGSGLNVSGGVDLSVTPAIEMSGQIRAQLRAINNLPLIGGETRVGIGHTRFGDGCSSGQRQIDYEEEIFDANVLGFDAGDLIADVEFCIEHFSMTVTASAMAEINATLDLAAEASLTIDGGEVVNIGLGSYPLPGALAFLSFKPSFILTAQGQIYANLSGSIGLTASAGVNVPLGFEWRRGAGLNPIAEVEPQPPMLEPVLEADAAIGTTVTLSPQIQMTLGVSGLEEVVGSFPGVDGSEARVISFGDARVGVRIAGNAEYSPVTSGEEIACLTAKVTAQPFVTAAADITVDFPGSGGMLDPQTVGLGSTGVDGPTITLGSWDDAGEYCLEADEQELAELLERYNEIYDFPMEECRTGGSYGSVLEEACPGFLTHCFIGQDRNKCEATLYNDKSYKMEWNLDDGIDRILADAPSEAVSIDVISTQESIFESERHLDRGIALAECATSEVTLYAATPDQEFYNETHITLSEVPELLYDNDAMEYSEDATEYMLQEEYGATMPRMPEDELVLRVMRDGGVEIECPGNAGGMTAPAPPNDPNFGSRVAACATGGPCAFSRQAEAP